MKVPVMEKTGPGRREVGPIEMEVEWSPGGRTRLETRRRIAPVSYRDDRGQEMWRQVVRFVASKHPPGQDGSMDLDAVGIDEARWLSILTEAGLDWAEFCSRETQEQPTTAGYPIDRGESPVYSVEFVEAVQRYRSCSPTVSVVTADSRLEATILRLAVPRTFAGLAVGAGLAREDWDSLDVKRKKMHNDDAPVSMELQWRSSNKKSPTTKMSLRRHMVVWMDRALGRLETRGPDSARLDCIERVQIGTATSGFARLQRASPSVFREVKDRALSVIYREQSSKPLCLDLVALNALEASNLCRDLNRLADLSRRQKNPRSPAMSSKSPSGGGKKKHNPEKNTPTFFSDDARHLSFVRNRRRDGASFYNALADLDASQLVHFASNPLEFFRRQTKNDPPDCWTVSTAAAAVLILSDLGSDNTKALEFLAEQDSLETPVEALDAYLFSNSNEARRSKSGSSTNRQDLTKNLTEYWIASSHNTYLEGDQWASHASVRRYMDDLSEGCRCVEMDVWDGPKNRPVVTHGRTLTTRIDLEEVVRAVRDYAFFSSSLPLILSLENHCSRTQQERVAQVLSDTLGDALLIRIDPAAVSPSALRGKVLLKAKRGDASSDDGGCSADACSADSVVDDNQRDVVDNQPSPNNPGGCVGDESPSSSSETRLVVSGGGDTHRHQKKRGGGHHRTITRSNSSSALQSRERRRSKVSPALAAIAALPAVKFEAPVKNGPDPLYVSSLPERKAAKLDPDRWARHNAGRLSRTYPDATRLASSNYDPLPAWAAGCQLVALNYQTSDRPMRLNRALFAGSQGYVLKKATRATTVEITPLFAKSTLEPKLAACLHVHGASSLNPVALEIGASVRLRVPDADGPCFLEIGHLDVSDFQASAVLFLDDLRPGVHCLNLDTLQPSTTSTTTPKKKRASFAIVEAILCNFLIINIGDDTPRAASGGAAASSSSACSSTAATFD